MRIYHFLLCLDSYIPTLVIVEYYYISAYDYSPPSLAFGVNASAKHEAAARQSTITGGWKLVISDTRGSN